MIAVSATGAHILPPRLAQPGDSEGWGGASGTEEVAGAGMDTSR
jgi:hypothetical protein